MNSPFFRALTLACLLVTYGTAPRAEGVVVIINKENQNSVDGAYIAKLYTGTVKGWPDGSPVFLLDQMEDSNARVTFYGEFVGRSQAAMRAVWSQNIFTGRGLPPRIASPDAEMKRLVAANRNAIGYILSSQVDGTVRVLSK